MQWSRLVLLVCLLTWLPRPSAAEDKVAEDKVQPADVFRSKVAPILERRCFSCHNRTDRKGDLSLQRWADVEASGYLEAGDPDASHLLAVISPGEGKRPSMPKDGDALTAEQVGAIRQWIAGGAAWPEDYELQPPRVTDTSWWSLQPLARPPLPVLKPGDGDETFRLRTPIDAFVLAALQQQGLTPSPEADRRTLIRRLYFDLIGLPPSPADIERFLSDDDPRAYEHLVDRLLESPRYGERWARHWLDVVKYADTCGYDKDKLRPNAWPYRDYVIRSFNDDKPYWRFVHEQLAGDVLFPGTADGILGLGFIAAGPWDFIGHVEVPEKKIDGKVARHIDRDDMVCNTLNTFNSVTIQCTRCHNHKFDPFTQQHYYRLQAVFAAVDRAERAYDVDPEVVRQRQALEEQQASLQGQLQALEDRIKQEGGPALARLTERIEQLKPKTVPQGKKPAFGYHSQIEQDADRQKWVQVNLGRPRAVNRVVLRPCHDDFANIGAGFGFPVRFKVEASHDADFQKGVVLLDDRTQQDVSNPGLAPHMIAADGVAARYVRITATRLARRSNDYIFALAELQVEDEAGENVALRCEVTSLDSIEAPVRWTRKNLTDGTWVAAGDEQATLALAAAERERQQLLDRVNTLERQAEQKKLQGEIKSVTERLARLPQGKLVYAAATHFKPQGNFHPTQGKPREIHMLHRGNVLDPREPMRPGTLPLIPGAPEEFELAEGHSEGERRAMLARWLTRDDNPLTWRSIVNRIWLYHFGRGLVDSPNDFGRMGQLPSHPDLLDWLACEFRDGGQSIKNLHRLIANSSVYRQSSAHRAAPARTDSGNRYLWRMNRRRLEAEEIRDAILAVSGKLDLSMYGPGFYLFALEKTEHSPHYEYHKHDPEDPASHRRSIYRFIARSQPDPFMTTLDCTDSSQSTPKRDETLTALQALSLLNNKFTLSMSAHFARRLEAESEALPAQIERGVWLVAGRPPTPQEREQLQTFAARFGLPNACRVLFNLSEFTYLD